MEFSKALVAYDGSDHARKALDTAYGLVDCGALSGIVVLAVNEPFEGSDEGMEVTAKAMGAFEDDEAEAAHEKMKQDIAKGIEGREEITNVVYKIGKPAREIIATAEQEGCDLIVVGSRGLGKIRALLGSVSTAVVRDAGISVLTIK